jgi:hypothetical protein
VADNGHAPDGICIGFGSNWNDTSPTWTRLDDPKVAVWGYKVAAPHHCNVVSNWSVDRGRSYELDKTQTGTATITLQDPNGLFDPTNASSPFYLQIGAMLPVSISLFNPANTAYTVVFTGFVESWSWTITTEERLEIVTLSLVDGFEPLSRAELVPDTTGAIYSNAGNGTTVIVGDTAGTACQTRINGLLDTAAWPTGARWRNVNTGNIFLQGVAYNPGTSILSAIQDCADAEFPGVANVFIAKTGALTFYGRYPRFQPTNFPQDVQFWQVGDANAANTFGAARIAVIEWNIDQTHLYNACLCYPTGIQQSDIEGQLFTNSASATAYGYRALTLPDILVFGQPAGSGSSAQTPQPFTQSGANAVCVYYSQYYVDNYKLPQIRISRLEFHSRLPGDSQTWQFLCGVEIGDIVNVFTSGPGGGGFGKETDGLTPAEFFVEGIHYQVQPLLNSSIVDVTMTLDVSPRAFFNTAPWQ